MDRFRFTLLSDGSSDQALLPILRWTLLQCGLDRPMKGEWADLRDRYRTRGLVERVRAALQYYPCEMLFVHRDAESAPRSVRVEEIRGAVGDARVNTPAVHVVPVRMQEAWLLFDEAAIRRAAANRNGTIPLTLPQLRKVESLPDPKSVLHELLRTASERTTGRRRKKFRVEWAALRVSDFISDFSPLRELSAFRAFEQEVRSAAQLHFPKVFDL